MKLLIDADLIVYNIGFACQKTYYSIEILGIDTVAPIEFTKKRALKNYIAKQLEADPLLSFKVYSHVVAEPIENALYLAKKKVESIINKAMDVCQLKETEAKLFLTSDDKSNFRFQIAKTRPYKGKRGTKPVHYQAIREYLVKKYGAIVVTGKEADDAIAEYARANPNKYLICSYDKDFLNIPGHHFNWKTNKYMMIKPHQALKNFYLQMLVGDEVDNIEGIKGIGYRNANLLIPDPIYYENELFHGVLKIYREKSTEEHFWENIDLLWLGPSNERKSVELKEVFINQEEVRC